MEPYFTSGDQAAIAQAKAQWRREYKAAWRKSKRKRDKEVTLCWTPAEYRELTHEAKRHNMNVTQYCKAAILGYMHRRYVVPNQLQVQKILQLLALTYNTLIEQEQSTPQILKLLQELERDIRIRLFSPKSIEQVLTELNLTKAGRDMLLAHLQTMHDDH